MSQVGQRTSRDGEMTDALQQEQGSSGGPGRRVLWSGLTWQGVLGPRSWKVFCKVFWGQVLKWVGARIRLEGRGRTWVWVLGGQGSSGRPHPAGTEREEECVWSRIR